jgi:hypothetical protein
MSEPDQASTLTGVWSGEYWYSDGARTRFAATLAESLGSLTGATLEPAPNWLAPVAELSATLSGTRQGPEVTFSKVYDGQAQLGLVPIAYTGAANAELDVIEGDWSLIGQNLTGGFVMRRVKSGKKAAARKAESNVVVVEFRKARRKAPLKIR